MAGSRRFSVASKILVIAASFALPITVLVYFVISTIQQDIDFATLELKGNVYQRPLEQILEAVQLHELIAGSCGTHGDCATALAPLRTTIDEAFVQLKVVDAQVGKDLQFTDQGLAQRGRQAAKAASVAAEWRDVDAVAAQASSATMPPALAGKYDHLVDDLRLMITHAGDESNLILDPQIDSYYLVDVTLMALPENQDRLGRAILFGRDLLTKGQGTVADQIHAALDAATLQDGEYQRVQDSLNRSLSENPGVALSASYQHNVPLALAAYKTATPPFIAMVKQLADGGQHNFTADQFVAAGKAARAASFTLWQVADHELDALLVMRIAARNQARIWALALSALALILSSGLAYLIMRSITQPLDRLARSLGPGATLLSQSVNRIGRASDQKSTSPEESAIICEELTAHAEDMRSAVGELVSLINGGAIPPPAASPAAGASHPRSDLRSAA